MFCENCGNQINSGDVFCGNCGATVQNNVNQGIINNIKNDFLSKLLLASGIIFLMQAILWFVGSLKVTDMKYADFGESYSMHSSFVKAELPWVSYVVVALFIYSAVLCLKPILKNLTNTYFSVIFQKIILILYTIWNILIIVVYNKSSGCSLTFGFILNIILIIILHILLFKIGKIAKKIPDKYAIMPDDSFK